MLFSFKSSTFVKGQWTAISVRKAQADRMKKTAKRFGYSISELTGLAITDFLANLKMSPTGPKPKKH